MKDSIGSYHCICRHGYWPVNHDDDSRQAAVEPRNYICIDEDECATKRNSCDNNSQCKNNIGSYTCHCNDGFVGNGMSCDDIDECSERLHNCHLQAKCINKPGGFKCECIKGFEGNGTNCSNVDECILGMILHL